MNQSLSQDIFDIVVEVPIPQSRPLYNHPETPDSNFQRQAIPIKQYSNRFLRQISTYTAPQTRHPMPTRVSMHHQIGARRKTEQSSGSFHAVAVHSSCCINKQNHQLPPEFTTESAIFQKKKQSSPSTMSFILQSSNQGHYRGMSDSKASKKNRACTRVATEPRSPEKISTSRALEFYSKILYNNINRNQSNGKNLFSQHQEEGNKTEISMTGGIVERKRLVYHRNNPHFNIKKIQLKQKQAALLLCEKPRIDPQARTSKNSRNYYHEHSETSDGLEHGWGDTRPIERPGKKNLGMSSTPQLAKSESSCYVKRHSQRVKRRAKQSENFEIKGWDSFADNEF